MKITIVTPKCVIEIERRKVLWTLLHFLNMGFLCIFFNVTASECNVLALFFFLFYCNTSLCCWNRKRKNNLNTFKLLDHWFFCCMCCWNRKKEKVIWTFSHSLIISILFYFNTQLCYWNRKKKSTLNTFTLLEHGIFFVYFLMKMLANVMCWHYFFLFYCNTSPCCWNRKRKILTSRPLLSFQTTV